MEYGFGRTYIARLGRIASNWTIVFFALTLLSLVGIFLFAFYWLLIVCVVLLTLGLIFAIMPGFGQSVASTSDAFASFIVAMQTLRPVFAGLTLALAALSTALMLCEHGYRRRYGRIVFAAIAAVFSAAVFLIEVSKW